MQKGKILFLMMILVLLLVQQGCSGSQERERLLCAEEMMDSHPDSALMMLDLVNPSSLRDEDLALYGLLLTQAKDKNHLNIENDTIIDKAVDYYSQNKDDKRLAVATYYQGRVYYARKKYADAILSFFKAKGVSEEIGDPFISGLSCRGIGDIYCDLRSSEDELEYAKKSYAYMRQSGRKIYELYALNDLGLAYFNTLRLDSGLLVGRQLEREAGDDETLKDHAHRLMALCLMEKGNPSESLPLWTQLMGNPDATTRDSLTFCRALLGVGEIDKAEQFLANVSDGDDDSDKVLRMLVNITLARSNGDLNAAFNNLARYDAGVQDLIDNSQRQKLPTTISDYFELHNKLYQEQAKSAKTRNTASLICLFLFAVISVLVVYVIRNKHRLKLKENIEKIQQLADDRQILEDDQLRLTTRHQQIMQELHKSEEQVRRSEEEIKRLGERESSLMAYLSQIMEQRLNMLRRMRQVIEQVQTAPDRGDLQEMREVIEKIDPYIRRYEIKKEELSQLESYLDLSYNGLMKQFRCDVKLSENDYNIYLLSLLNQSCSRIAGLLGLNGVNQVYIRRRHIRTVIERMTNKEKADEYIEGMQKGLI